MDTGTLTRDIDMARNIFGRLDSRVRDRLLAYAANPTTDAWDDVSSILLTPRLTVWQAWLAIYPDAPKVGRATDARGRVVRDWSAIPTPRQFEAAIAYATH